MNRLEGIVVGSIITAVAVGMLGCYYLMKAECWIRRKFR